MTKGQRAWFIGTLYMSAFVAYFVGGIIAVTEFGGWFTWLMGFVVFVLIQLGAFIITRKVITPMMREVTKNWIDNYMKLKDSMEKK